MGRAKSAIVGGTAMKPQLRIGISGWRYAPWRGRFYPKDLTQKRELEFASRQFNTIEINGSFYSLQHVNSWKRWAQETPDDFVFAVKGSRFITHMKKLRDVETPLANFFAQGVLALGEKLGPILWQFPPNFGFNTDRIEHFFNLLPRDMKQAARLAKRHDERLKDRSFFAVKENHPLRYAMEVRHHTFAVPEFIALLRKHNIALVVADTAGRWPFMEDVTADFVYVRLHGDEELYVSGYTPAALDGWAERVLAWRDGRQSKESKCVSTKSPPKKKSRDVFVYFDNDAKVRAPPDALGLAQRIGGFLPEKLPLMKEDPDGFARENWPG
jgi:uncharacterized protein YecE (DUF72 family)